MSMVQQAIEVGAPLHTVYEQLATFENYPRFMTGVEQVVSIGNQRTHWVMDVDGHRREFDAQITELELDERISWTSMDGPRLSETITIRPMGETRTQVVAQLEADIAFLMPSDRHGQQALSHRLKHDLSTLKGLIESGLAAPATDLGAASSKQLAGRSSAIFSVGSAASPTSVAARIRSKPPTDPGPNVAADPGPNVDAPSRRVAGRGAVSGGAAGSAAGRLGIAPMGGRTTKKDAWGDGMINEEDRGSAHDC
jgi:Polyketide cyclase / dehydrase and lipid transport